MSVHQPSPRRHRRVRRGRVIAAAWAALIAALLAGAAPASAHVTATATDISDEGVATVNFSFSHGCDGQPTIALRVQIPEGVSDVAPQPAEGFTTQTGAPEFAWVGGSIPDGQRATFTATMRVWGDEGHTIWLKTVQACPTAEEAWVEEQAPGQAEPEFVSPSIVLPRAIAAPSTTSTASPTTTTGAAPSTTSTTTGNDAITDEGSPSSTAGLIVFVVVCAVLAGGASILYLRHRRPRVG